MPGAIFTVRLDRTASSSSCKVLAMPQPSSSKSSFARQARKTAREERAIQARIDRKDRSRPKQAKSKSPMQVGQREYPASFPEQHLKKPGLEAELKPAPMYEAPAYKGSEKLKDRVALVTGGDSGIGRAVAVL